MRTMAYQKLEEIANLPEVRPSLGLGDQRIELRDIVGKPGNFCFANDDGGFVVIRLTEGLYEAHTIFPPDKNVRNLIKLMWDAQEFMFLETDCMNLCSKVPEDNEGAIWLAGMARFGEPVFHRNGVWRPGVAVRYHNLPLDRWAGACSTSLRAVGEFFHGLLAQAKQAQGITDPQHPDDALHDQMVGLAYKMIAAGNVGKGVDTYNRYALLAGYVSMQVVWGQPLVLDTGDAVIQVRNGQMEILSCR